MKMSNLYIFTYKNECPDDCRKTWLVYLVSHQRPMVELLQPNRKDITGIFQNEFARMTQVDVTVQDLEETREELINRIMGDMSEAEKKFLFSFKSKTPDWSLLGLDSLPDIANLPAIRWKQRNLEQMPGKKHSGAVERLRRVLKL